MEYAVVKLKLNFLVEIVLIIIEDLEHSLVFSLIGSWFCAASLPLL
jgi:hypothetical protein